MRATAILYDSTWSVGEWLSEAGGGWPTLLLAFVAAQLVNVLLSTIRSVILIKGSTGTAVAFNAISYTVSALVTGLIAGVMKNVPLICAVTALTNVVGTWVGLRIVEAARRDRLWRISATVKTSQFKSLVQALHKADIDFITYSTHWEERTPIDVFSKSRRQSSEIKEIFGRFDVKYTISTDTKLL